MPAKGAELKLTFTPPKDNQVHVYCLFCKSEKVQEHPHQGGLSYHCRSCGNVHTRALIIDPRVSWWCAQDGEYWHETAGIFLANARGEFLFFERKRHPFGLTVPAGHVDKGEAPTTAARREGGEETGVYLASNELHLIGTDDIYGDECRRGSDVHRWHSFFAKVPPNTSVNVDEREGINPVWLRLTQALSYNLTPATRYVIERHDERIHNMTS